MRRTLSALMVIAAGCQATPVESPLPPLAEQPVRVRVVELLDTDDPMASLVRSRLKSGLARRGYEIVRRNDATADAELWFVVKSHDEERHYPGGRLFASVGISAGLESTHTRVTLWTGRGDGSAQEEDCDSDGDLGDALFEWAFDSAADAILAPDYDQLSAEAASDAVADLLSTLPDAVRAP